MFEKQFYMKKLGIWASPGGHIEPKETPEQGAFREILEETGIRAKLRADFLNDLHTKQIADQQLPDPYAVMYEIIPETPKEGPSHIRVDFVYVFDADDREKTTAQESESEGVKWMTRAEILAPGFNCFDMIREFAKENLIK